MGKVVGDMWGKFVGGNLRIFIFDATTPPIENQ